MEMFSISGSCHAIFNGDLGSFYYAVVNYQNIASSTFDVYYPPAAYVIYSILLIILNFFLPRLMNGYNFLES